LKSCASVASANEVAMPTRETIHIQKIAPGPPRIRARATPVMFPMPIRVAMPIANAWNDEIPPSAPRRERPT
jgi:hypothetical protein